MEEVAWWGSAVLAMIFISTGWSKVKAMDEHVGIVMAYRILPYRAASGFAKADAAVQLLVSLMLLLGVFRQAALVVVILLLLLYTVAIGVNLLRGKREISCGCGGVMGDHRLSWGLVVRNVLMAGVCGWLISIPVSFRSWSDVLSMKVVQIDLIALLTLLTAAAALKLYQIWKRMGELNESMTELRREK